MKAILGIIAWILFDATLNSFIKSAKKLNSQIQKLQP